MWKISFEYIRIHSTSSESRLCLNFTLFLNENFPNELQFMRETDIKKTMSIFKKVEEEEVPGGKVSKNLPNRKSKVNKNVVCTQYLNCQHHLNAHHFRTLIQNTFRY